MLASHSLEGLKGGVHVTKAIMLSVTPHPTESVKVQGITTKECLTSQESLAIAPASLANSKVVAERGLITHLNGRGYLIVRHQPRRMPESPGSGSGTSTHRIKPSWYSTLSFSPTGTDMSNTASVQAILRNKVRRAKCLPGQVL